VSVIERLESEVRSYCRSFPTTFVTARGARIEDEDGVSYLDFFSGAGALNYGHNHPRLKRPLLEYLTDDGIVHGLDMATAAKEEFLTRFESVILAPRRLDYKVQFPGPTGTNAVEAALKLARKYTQRTDIISFTNAFHGMTLGALAITGNRTKRAGAGIPLAHGQTLPYDGYMGEGHDTLDYLEKVLDDHSSGIDLPAAVIVETVQGEGGLQVASNAWLQRLATLCRSNDVLLIVDDVQAGCGRTGPFFSFERAGIYPDIVCLSKSLSGYGMPLSVTLMRRELDCWDPGEHNGTFRGFNPALVTATEAFGFWLDPRLEQSVLAHGEVMRAFLVELAAAYPGLDPEVRGIGCMQGLRLAPEGRAERVCGAAFERGLLLETSGPQDEVIKLMPPLIADEVQIKQGLEILADSMASIAAADR